MVGHALPQFDGTSRRLATPGSLGPPPTTSQQSAIGSALYRTMKPIAIAVLRESSLPRMIELMLGASAHGRKRLVWLLKLSGTKGHMYDMGTEIFSDVVVKVRDWQGAKRVTDAFRDAAAVAPQIGPQFTVAKLRQLAPAPASAVDAGDACPHGCPPYKARNAECRGRGARSNHRLLIV
jgi:hypothetical protein